MPSNSEGSQGIQLNLCVHRYMERWARGIFIPCMHMGSVLLSFHFKHMIYLTPYLPLGTIKSILLQKSE